MIVLVDIVPWLSKISWEFVLQFLSGQGHTFTNLNHLNKKISFSKYVFLSEKDWKINSSFDGPEAPKVQASKTGINFMISILLFVENYDTIRYMVFQYGRESVLKQHIFIWFWSHTRKFSNDKSTKKYTLKKTYFGGYEFIFSKNKQ